MDVRDISSVFVLKNCGRTAGSDTIDGDTVTITQCQTPLEDDGSAAETYYGPGELLVTNTSGLSLTGSTATKAGNPAIMIKQRSHNGKNHLSTPAIKGSSIKSYTLTPYKATTQQVTIIHTIDASLTDTTYMLKIRRIGSEVKALKEPTVKTAMYRVGATAETAAQIAAGLIADINKNFNNDLIIPVVATLTGAAANEITIQAKAFYWELGKYKYQRLKFVVELVNFTATIVNNMYGSITRNSVTHLAATIGAGNYEQVADMEYQAKLYTGANINLLSGTHKRSVVEIDAQQYEDDGTTPNRYDTIVIGWENTQGDYSMNVHQMGNVILFLPLDNNTTNQQDAVLDSLNKYIATDWGVDAAITLS